MGYIVLLISCVVISYFMKWLVNFLKIRSLVNKIPGPRSYFLIGNLLQIRNDPYEWFDHTRAASYIYKIPKMLRIWLGPFAYVGIHGADEAQAILSSKNNDKGPEYKLLHPWLKQGLITSSSNSWRARRKILTPTFHYDILKDFIKVFNSQSQTLVKRLAPFCSESSVNVYRYINLCTLDILCESAMGRNVQAQITEDSDYVTAIEKINEIAAERQKQPWMWFTPIFNMFGRGKEFNWGLHIVHSFTASVINERLQQRSQSITAQAEHKPKRLAFLDLILELVEQEKMLLSDVQSEVDTFMFAGHESTTVSMNWVLHLLGTSPACQDKVLQEVDRVFGDDTRDIKFEDLQNLSYLERCVKEALRLFPAVPLYTRMIREDVHIGEYTVPSGTQVVLNPGAIHRDPVYWPDPDIFDPDRFLPENCEGRHPFCYIPFSAGNRNCIGQRFAFLEEKVVLAQFFRYFKIRSIHRRDQVNPYAALTLKPSDGVCLKLSSRRPLPF